MWGRETVGCMHLHPPLSLAHTIQSFNEEMPAVCGMEFLLATTWRMYVWQGCGNVYVRLILVLTFFLPLSSLTFCLNRAYKLSTGNNELTHRTLNDQLWLNHGWNSMKWEITWSILNISHPVKCHESSYYGEERCMHVHRHTESNQRIVWFDLAGMLW